VKTGSPAGAGTTTGAGAGVTGVAGPAGVVGVGAEATGAGGRPGDGVTTAGVGVITVGAPGGGGVGSAQAAKGTVSITARHIKTSIFFKSPLLSKISLSLQVYCQPIYHPLQHAINKEYITVNLLSREFNAKIDCPRSPARGNPYE